MSGSSLDGLDLVFAEISESAGKWTYEIKAAACYEYSLEWQRKLQSAIYLNALEYQMLHAEYGHYLGRQVNAFIEANHLQYQTALIASHGHTTFHVPQQRTTAQLGDGAAIAAETQLPVVSDLRALDVAFGGQGAPIVPFGEKLLLSEYKWFLNIGGIANLSFNTGASYVAFDVCPANRVLNLICNEIGKPYDDGGSMAAAGTLNANLLELLNSEAYYRQPFPKSLANDFGVEQLFPIVQRCNLPVNDALNTYTEHIVQQVQYAVKAAIQHAGEDFKSPSNENGSKLLVTGGGAFNNFLVRKLTQALAPLNIEVVVPDSMLIQYKEALIMALIGILRWRQEYNVLASVTGATRNSIGGAVWIGQQA